MVESRDNDVTLIECEYCGWKGTVSECVHSYEGIPLTEGEVEPVDYCPACGSVNLC